MFNPEYILVIENDEKSWELCYAWFPKRDYKTWKLLWLEYIERKPVYYELGLEYYYRKPQYTPNKKGEQKMMMMMSMQHQESKTSGNSAFDEWLKNEHKRLEETRKNFQTYREEIKRLKEQEEFNDFMNKRKDS